MRFLKNHIIFIELEFYENSHIFIFNLRRNYSFKCCLNYHFSFALNCSCFPSELTFHLPYMESKIVLAGKLKTQVFIEEIADSRCSFRWET